MHPLALATQLRWRSFNCWLKQTHWGLRLAGLALGLLLWLAQLAAETNSQTLLGRLDYLLYDWRFNLSLKHVEPGPSQVVIVDIDERSLAEVGRWPWSRRKLGLMMQHLAAAGAVVVAFDAVFSEPESNPVLVLKRQLNDVELAANWGDKTGLSKRQWLNQWQARLDADQAFADQLTEVDTVLGFFFQDDASYRIGELPGPLAELDAQQAERGLLINKPGFTGNLPVLQQAALSAGFVTTFTDVDGIVRRSPLIMAHEQGIYASLSLAAAMVYLFIDEVQIHSAPMGPLQAITGVQLADKWIPTDAIGRVTVPYRGGAFSYPYVSAMDVLHNQLDGVDLENRIVLVGTSATGLFDLRATPMGPGYPGVEVHANIIDGLLNGLFPYRPDWHLGLQTLVFALLGGFLALLMPGLGPIKLLTLALGCLAFLMSGNYYLWLQGIEVSLAALLLLVVGISLLNLVGGFLRENQNRQRLRSMFDQYVPPAHIEAMINTPDDYSFAGESKELSVLFSDIRGFTSISESLDAGQLKELLNRFFTPITEIIFARQGTIDKYVGDMVMAFWGAPMDDSQHAEHAVLAALSMLEKTEQLKQEFKQLGLPEVNIGIGISSGLMNVGDMGSSFRRSYTVIGDVVNLGARLESVTKFYGVKLLVSEATADQCSQVIFRLVDRMQVKGKEQSVLVYEPLGIKNHVSPERLAALSQYKQAYGCYLAQDWPQAARAFAELRQVWPNETLYAVYEERISELRALNLPADWDGTFVHTSK